MEGTLNEGDAVIVDCGVKAFIGDGIYLVSWANHTFMRRLLLAGSEQLELIPDNTKHKPRLVPQEDVTVHAKALVNMRMQAL
jgi:phage repressor protein C with HTH and peptisase S24 domain